MSRRNLVIASALALALAGGVLVAQNGGPPDGTPNIAGKWEGKLKYKNYEQSAGGEKYRGKQKITLNVSQDDEHILVQVTVETGDGPISFDLVGEIGNGHLWAHLEDEGLLMMLLGHVSKNGKKIKASVMGAFYGEAYFTEVKFTVKRAASAG